ncbi:MAG: hypothetical protein AB7T03_02595 [Bacilli bacterium]
MKKLNYLILLFVISLIIIGLIAMFSQQEKVFKLMTIPQAYSLVSPIEENETFSIGIYLNKKTVPFLNESSEINGFISDSENENHLPLKLLSALPNNGMIKINDTIFYLFNFQFQVVFSTTSKYFYELSEAFLHIDQGVDKEEIMILIGSFSFSKVPSLVSENFSITKLKGNVNSIEIGKSVVGFSMNIRNNTFNQITIKRIKPLVSNVSISVNDSIENFTYDFQVSEPIKTILGYNYEVIGTNDNQIMDFVIDGKDENSFYFALNYQTPFKINHFGLEITFEIDGLEFSQYLDNFTFFSDYQIAENELNQLVVHTYGND